MPFDDNAAAVDTERCEFVSGVFVKNTFIHICETTNQPVVGTASAPLSRYQPLRRDQQGCLTCDSASKLSRSPSLSNDSTENGLSHTTSVDDMIPSSDVEGPCRQSARPACTRMAAATTISLCPQEAPLCVVASGTETCINSTDVPLPSCFVSPKKHSLPTAECRERGSQRMAFDDHATALDIEQYECLSDVFVKNTFIHICETTDQLVVGTASAPPSTYQPPRCDQQGCLTYDSANKLSHSRNLSNGSTEAGLSHTTSLDDIGSSSDVEGPCAQSAWSVCTCVAAAANTSMYPQDALVAGGAECCDNLTDAPLSSWSVIGSGAQDQSRTPLDTRAEPFMCRAPHSYSSGPEALPPKATVSPSAFNRQVLAVAAEVEATMRCTGVILDVQVNRVQNGWGVVALMRSGNGRQRSRVLEAARQSVINVVERSRCARVVHKHGNAFTESMEGFSIELGSVEDDASACWDIFACGCCPREGHCPWQHPTCQQHFVFAVTSEDSS